VPEKIPARKKPVSGEQNRCGPEKTGGTNGSPKRETLTTRCGERGRKRGTLGRGEATVEDMSVASNGVSRKEVQGGRGSAARRERLLQKGALRLGKTQPKPKTKVLD